MALELSIPPCIHNPHHHLHLPPPTKPLRIQIQGPLESIQKLLPKTSFHKIVRFPQPGRLELAIFTHQALYGEEGLKKADGIPTVRDEYLAWAMEGRIPLDYIDYYGVTFDHLVPADDPNPEVLAISIIEVDNDGGAFANRVLSFQIDPTEYTGKKVLAVPRCCQVKKGTQDRRRWNGLVAERDMKIRGCCQRFEWGGLAETLAGHVSRDSDSHCSLSWLIEKMLHDDVACFSLATALDEKLRAASQKDHCSLLQPPIFEIMQCYYIRKLNRDLGQGPGRSQNTIRD